MVFCNVLLVFLISLQLGSYQMMIDNSLAAYTGHIQVQHRGYLEQQRMRQSVPAVSALAQTCASPGAWRRRRPGHGLCPGLQRGALLRRVAQRRAASYEPGVSTFPGLIRQGRYLTPGDSEQLCRVGAGAESQSGSGR